MMNQADKFSRKNIMNDFRDTLELIMFSSIIKEFPDLKKEILRVFRLLHIEKMNLFEQEDE